MPETGRPVPLQALLRLHCRAGARLSLRTLVPLAGLVVIAVGMQSSPTEGVAAAARALAAPDPDPAALLLVAAVSLTIAGWAVPRVTQGAGGWLRHLPVGAADHRRAAVLALAVAQAPLFAAVAALMIVAVASGSQVSSARAAGLPLVALGSACAVLPVRGRASAGLLGAMGMALALTGNPLFLGLAGLALAAADRFAGPLEIGGRERRFEERPGPHLVGRIAFRAMGPRTLGPLLSAMIPLAGCMMLIANNDLAPGVTTRAARLAGGLSATILLAGMSELLAARRPAWPWARSLPWSAARRVRSDALFLGLHTLPVIAAAAWIDWRAGLTLPALVPLLSLRAAAAMRRAPASVTGSAGRVLAEGFVIAGVTSLIPWAIWPALAATPIAAHAAARDEKAQKASRWSELHHLAQGDPVSWSGG